ncbi:MAG: NfeD family protein [Caulobacter sp.]|nr:NfeD family protein [Caulobacter sp.]
MTWLIELYVTHPLWVWLAVGGLFLAAEVVTGTGWLLWPAASTVVVALLSTVLPGGFPVDLTVFAALTIATTLLGRRYLPTNVSGDGPDINDNLGRVVGRQGVTVAAFEHGQGRVFIDGKEWAAVVEGDAQPALDQPVTVIATEGSVLRVKVA